MIHSPIKANPRFLWAILYTAAYKACGDETIMCSCSLNDHNSYVCGMWEQRAINNITSMINE